MSGKGRGKCSVYTRSLSLTSVKGRGDVLNTDHLWITLYVSVHFMQGKGRGECSEYK